jgi:hypothetical protein
MKTILLAAGAIALALTAGQALGAKHHKSTAATAEPKQPIPYAELDAYLKASPKQRARKDWWAQASIGASANASAVSTAGADQPSAAPAATPETAAPPSTANPPSAGGGTVNPPTTATPPSSTPSTTDNPPPK